MHGFFSWHSGQQVFHQGTSSSVSRSRQLGFIGFKNHTSPFSCHNNKGPKMGRTGCNAGDPFLLDSGIAGLSEDNPPGKQRISKKSDGNTGV